VKPWQKAIPKDRLAHIIKDATRGLVRALSARLAEHEVSFGHWTFLRILWEHDGLTQRELSDEAGVAEPSTNAAIKAMEQLGYVTRTRLPDNRKNIYVRLTPKGRALKAKLVPLAEAVNRDAVRGLSARDVETARRVLLAVTENLRKIER
jgi:DNA-binding MarR family transcriptional regulator